MKIDKKLYNSETKERYLKTLDKGTEHVVSSIFMKVSELEDSNNRDLADFSISQFEELLIFLDRKSLSSLSTSLSNIKLYIDYAIENGYVNSRLNVAEAFNRDNIRRYVNQVAKTNRVINEEEFNDILNETINAQDQAIFILL